MTKKFLRTEPGERVDAPDFKRAAALSILETHAEIGERFILGSDAGEVGFILDGFGVTNTAGKVVTVAGGTAVLGMRFEGRVYNGVIGTAGVASRSIDVAAYPAGTYGVYVRATLKPDESSHRYFWDAAVAPAVEIGRGIPTRYTEDWDIAIEEASPGAEWLRVATVDQAALNGAGAGIVDLRKWFFEGEDANAYAAVDAEWGGGNDRNVDRATYGVKGLRRFARAVQRQIQDIIGSTLWSDTLASVSALSLGTLSLNKLDRAGGVTSTVTGVIQPNANATRDFGTTAARFLTIFTRFLRARTLTLGDLELGSAADALIARIYANYSNTAGRDRMLLLHLEKDASVSGSEIRVYAVRSGYGGGLFATNYVEVAFNCEATAAGQWEFEDNTRDAIVYVFTLWGTATVRRAAFAGSPWNDDGVDWTVQATHVVGPTPSLYTAGLATAVSGFDTAAAADFTYSGPKTIRRSIVANAGTFAATFSGWSLLDPETSNSVNFRALHQAGNNGAIVYPIYPPDGATIVDAVINLTVAGLVGPVAMNIVAVPNSGGAAVPLKAADTTVAADGTADHTVTVDVGHTVNTNTHSYAIWVFADTGTTSVHVNRLEWRFSVTKVTPA